MSGPCLGNCAQCHKIVCSFDVGVGVAYASNVMHKVLNALRVAFPVDAAPNHTRDQNT